MSITHHTESETTMTYDADYDDSIYVIKKQTITKARRMKTEEIMRHEHEAKFRRHLRQSVSKYKRGL